VESIACSGEAEKIVGESDEPVDRQRRGRLNRSTDPAAQRLMGRQGLTRPGNPRSRPCRLIIVFRATKNPLRGGGEAPAETGWGIPES
jgi:hypothetical protein